ncbi:hypothetical protein [Candidatus Berkiella aquae]|uniref:Uncharacterized protein n=1 Tax=Candidatus Berkiella aquae TaxID=295108 RepID=A0A0Q9Y950_9GAMM|nr:hypothetical protein [Candidatus Berkiella aquae]MCS5709967.1 hypothetical protein [Candidatus Berkiella aquae]
MSSLLEELQSFTMAVFDNPQMITDEAVRESGKEVLGEIKAKGFVVRKHLLDKQARNVFVTIQASAERKAVDDVAKATGTTTAEATQTSSSSSSVPSSSTAIAEDKVIRKAYVELQTVSEKVIVDRLNAVKDLGRIAKSIWIIHTPMIATPCVTDGTPTPKLVAEEIIKDDARRNLTLSRAAIIRDYLAAGGVLITAYDGAQREEKLAEDGTVVSSGRTKVQIEIFEKLKEQFPTQIIDFPMDLKTRQAKLGLNAAVYPDEMIGATYLIEDTYGQRFEMTNQGVQAIQPRDDAQWGVWMQNRSHPVLEVSKRMAKVCGFLQNAGLNQVLAEHALKHNINQDDFAPLLNRYFSLEIDAEKGIGCGIQ